MQFYLITPLFLVSLFKWPRFGYGLIILSICASCCYRCILTINYNLFQPLSSLPNYIDGDLDSFIHGNMIQFDTLYMKPFQNICTYLIGLGWGHYLMKREKYAQREVIASWFYAMVGLDVSFQCGFVSMSSIVVMNLF
ncbi:hypothetical protein TNCT_119411 [Trichonephila clavata]|uniref:Uncharacterized protein n=1 Tax=Trichonephila clavata TaxID=2740835 RepID=A0A8X6G827_TRICU|nr:hypothetical protein TNCT_119411 [Trichonephila clavata]